MPERHINTIYLPFMKETAERKAEKSRICVLHTVILDTKGTKK